MRTRSMASWMLLISIVAACCGSTASAQPSFVAKWGQAGAANGQFNTARGVAIDNNGLVWVVDSNNHRLQQFNLNGVFQLATGKSGSGDGQFFYPYDIAVDPTSGDLFVADTGNNRIQRLTAGGSFVSKFGGLGSGDGQFHAPAGIELDGSGNIFVADNENHRIQKFDNSG